MRVKARGKINWTLDIEGVRGDGYHLIDTLMQSVELYDTLAFERADGLLLQVDGPMRVTADENNLVTRAMRLLAERLSVSAGCVITLTKRIPIGAGMGGGSADAAAALAGLNRFWRLSLKEAELNALALELGADTPFCLTGGLQRATGVGERLERLPVNRPAYLVIAQPCWGLSTPEMFQRYDEYARESVVPPRRPDNERAVRAARDGSLARMCAAMGNVLQPAAILQRPEIAQAIQTLEHLGAIRAQMTGSGSAVFGVFASAWAAQYAWERVSTIWRRCWTTRTASRGLVFREWLT
ncbi:MAG: 4-(cytidine 5'-diphospho)-2-C-methyl-D-erythritol kinase [Oscillospiraceae bacterium]|jgi:4-diphosphocytidyl-2-C-methyl-D-erythritol kinase|nr:4-(cytidine 5'-diphospho)-2-C-methyl-D-erythritol kinase [Oscillospiraceae bacterium]